MREALTETDASVDQPVEEQGASDDLDSLLNEFTEETKSEQTINPNDVKEAVGWINEQRQQTANEAEQTAINSATETIKEQLGDLDIPLTDGMIRGMLEDNARRDPKIRDAFAQRQKNPQAWSEALKRASKNIKEDLSIDQKATSDREAIASAVHSASTQQPTPDTPVDLNTMSDSKFARYKMGLK